MNFRDAITKSIRNFYSGKLPEKSIEASEEEYRYTLEYFDELDMEEPEEEAPKKASKKEKKEPEIEDREYDDEGGFMNG